jgi:7 transmembrane receptor (rhodopsin family)
MVLDLLMIVCNLPFIAISSLYQQWMFLKLGCNVYAFSASLSGFVSIATMTLISIERYLVIRNPFSALKTGSSSIACKKRRVNSTLFLTTYLSMLDWCLAIRHCVFSSTTIQPKPVCPRWLLDLMLFRLDHKRHVQHHNHHSNEHLRIPGANLYHGGMLQLHNTQYRKHKHLYPSFLKCLQRCN